MISRPSDGLARPQHQDQLVHQAQHTVALLHPAGLWRPDPAQDRNTGASNPVHHTDPAVPACPLPQHEPDKHGQLPRQPPRRVLCRYGRSGCRTSGSSVGPPPRPSSAGSRRKPAAAFSADRRTTRRDLLPQSRCYHPSSPPCHAGFRLCPASVPSVVAADCLNPSVFRRCPAPATGPQIIAHRQA
jgi:hypothetical protein